MTESLSHFVQKYFQTHLINQHNYGANTLSSYRDTFRLLLVFLGTEGEKSASLSLKAVDRDCLLRFLTWLKSVRRNAVSTCNVRLAHMRSFFGYVMSIAPEMSEHCSSIINLPFANTERKLPVSLGETETMHLLAAPDASTKEGLRHTAIISLLYDSGCRVQELIDMNVSDVTLGKGCRVHVRGKGDKHRLIPIMERTGAILEKYIKAYSPKLGDALFTNRQGSRLTRSGVQYIINKYGETVKVRYPGEINIGMTNHLLRHSKATHLVNAGVSIYNVRDFLGHSSVITTQVYLSSNPEVMRKAIEKASEKTVPNSTSFYSEQERADLLTFLDKLV
jgi:site-specific recombinase XerD